LRCIVDPAPSGPGPPFRKLPFCCDETLNRYDAFISAHEYEIMIARHWKGIAKPGEADNYINHLKTDTFPKIGTIDGFVKAYILTSETAKGTEFLIITFWDSMEAIKSFAGETADVAVVPAAVQAMMIEYDRNVIHYEVAESYSPNRHREQVKPDI
jgi:heme-degrading monooxygenase HmoA